jgi:protein SCO1/2
MMVFERNRLRLVRVPVLAAVAGLALTLGGCGTSHRPAAGVAAAGDAPSSSGLHGTELTSPLPAPDIKLTDDEGRPFDLATSTTKPLTLVFFGYTHCHDDCPTTMADIAIALRKLTPAQQQQISVVFVTADPWRDTGPVLHQWLGQFSPSFLGVTGLYTGIQGAAKAVGVDVEKPSSFKGDYDVVHGNSLLVFRPDHRVHVVYVAGVAATHLPDDLATDLPKLLHTS